MKSTKTFCFYIVCLLIQINVVAQFTFSQRRPPYPQLIANFENMEDGDISYADIDLDGDLDVLLVGEHNDRPVTVLYENDGLGNFNKVANVPFVKVLDGAADFGDIDGDGDPDLFIVGENEEFKLTGILYENIDGVFHLLEDSFLGTRHATVDFADVDGDEDLDLLITGFIVGTGSSTSLYQNDGTGSFLSIEHPFEPIQFGTADFEDVDSDGDMDLLLTGSNANTPVSELYLNDGMGNFQVFDDLPFPDVQFSSVAFGDYDNDEDLDVFIMGMQSDGSEITSLYLYSESLQYTLSNQSFDEGAFGSLICFDFENDGDLDLLSIRTGDLSEFGGRSSSFYLNDGVGTFVQSDLVPFEPLSFPSFALLDIDNNDDDDLIFSGSSFQNGIVTRAYRNMGDGEWLEMTGTVIDGYGHVSIGDFDQDSDLDLM
ncbi:MAG: VCBS repeat-containing protein, partial [Bacteroidota bacterium]